MKRYITIFMVFILLMSLLPAIAPVQANASEEKVRTSAIEENEILDNHLRIHFNNGELDVSDLRLWLYKDVATWSEEDNWPNGKSFPEGQTTDYGPYVDIELSENPELVELIVIYQGEALLDATKIEKISEGMNEVWISREGEISLYEP